MIDGVFSVPTADQTGRQASAHEKRDMCKSRPAKMREAREREREREKEEGTEGERESPPA